MKKKTSKSKEPVLSLTTQAMMAVLRDWAVRNKVTSVQVNFSGGGDSGSADQPDLEFEEGVAHGDNDDKLLAELPAALSMEKIADHAIEATGVDWYNNEGGNGYVDIDPRTGEVQVEMNQAVTTYDTTNHESTIEGYLSL